MKYGIMLISKYRRCDNVVLGIQCNPPQEAREFFEKECCTKCNRMELVYIHDGYEYIDSRIGFSPKTLFNDL